MKKLRYLVFLSLLLLVSCASTKAVFKANFAGLPAWYSMPQSSTGSKKYSFVGKGEGSTERQAELRAMTELYSNICSTLGLENNDEQYRELTLTKKIKAYGLKIKNSETVKKDGVYTVYLRAKGIKSLLEENVSAKIVEMREELSLIEQLILEGDEYIKVDNDIAAVEKYMESLCLSYDNFEVETEYSFDVILAECCDILSSTSIGISNVNKDRAECTVTVTRKDGHFVTKSVGCPVAAKFNAVGVDGKEYNDSFLYITGENGSFDFKPTNYSMLQAGSVSFCFGIETQLEQLEKTAGVEKVKDLRDAFENAKKSFDYSLVYTEGTIGLAVFDFDFFGDDSDYYIADYYRTKFKAARIKTINIEVNSQMENEEIIAKANSFDVSYLFISKSQITDTILSSSGEYAVNCEGSFILYDLKNNKILWESEPTNATGFDKVLEEAEKKSLYNLADLFFSLLRSVYV